MYKYQGTRGSDFGYCLNQFVRSYGEGFSWHDVELKELPFVSKFS